MTDPSLGSEPSAEAATNRDPFRKPSRRAVVVGAAWAVPSVMAVKAVPAWAASPTPCTAWTYQNLRAASQFLSGTLLGTRLSQVFSDPSWTGASLAQVRGIQVTTVPPNSPVPDPAPPASERLDGVANAPAYRTKLDLAALQALEVIAGVQLGSLIKAPVGVINQWAQAVYNGTVNGSTGAIDNSSGIIDTSAAAGSTTYASINLKNLLNNALSGGLNGLGTGMATNITDLSLDLGAIAGRAWQDTCTNCIKRDYLLAWAKLVVDSPLLAALYNPLVTIINGLQSTINGLIGPGSTVDGLLNQIENAINAINVLGLVKLTATANITVSLDTSAATAALGNDLFPSTKLLDLGLGPNETLTVDLGVLLGGAYQPDGTNSALNGLAPNTSLLVNTSAVTNLVNQIGGIGQDIVAVLEDLIKVNLSISVHAFALGIIDADVATIQLYSGASGTNPVSIADLLNNNFHFEVTLLPAAGALGGLLSALTTVLTGTLVTGLVGQIGAALHTLVVNAVLTSTVNSAITALGAFVNQLLTALFITPGVLSLTANAQNDPQVACTPPTGAGAEPSDWATLEAGEYDVAALRLAVLQSVSTNVVTLYLARGAVGPIVATAAAPVAP
ncbi:choice-of-anchor G family protein [Raineyella sp. LH-20]|uniref:choice-of-anchor G family protein n=1 Tax=Raineyella sp. LH-20 TaxID=3081204 RepID=UPI002952D7D6|nr:choice-of-anchor G family protein [Raineyella sp. LH-20]WOP20088.1 choice-of-anchor G family protein [Raineyella sp. LH-20]